MPSPIQTPGVGAALQRFFRIVGRVRLSLGDEIIPTVQVGNLSIASTPPVRRIATAQATQAAVAGEVPTFSFQIPPSVLAHLRLLSWLPATDQWIRLNSGSTINTAGFTQVDARFQDGRLVQAGELPGGVFFRGTQVGGLPTVPFRRFFMAAGSPPQPFDVVVGSGDGTNFGFFELQGSVANEQAQMSLEWDEYQLV